MDDKKISVIPWAWNSGKIFREVSQPWEDYSVILENLRLWNPGEPGCGWSWKERELMLWATPAQRPSLHDGIFNPSRLSLSTPSSSPRLITPLLKKGNRRMEGKQRSPLHKSEDLWPTECVWEPYWPADRRKQKVWTHAPSQGKVELGESIPEKPMTWRCLPPSWNFPPIVYFCTPPHAQYWSANTWSD